MSYKTSGRLPIKQIPGRSQMWWSEVAKIAALLSTVVQQTKIYHTNTKGEGGVSGFQIILQACTIFKKEMQMWQKIFTKSE